MRSDPLLALIPFVLTALAACAHDDGGGTATVRSGTPDGPRVTEVRTVPTASTQPSAAPTAPTSTPER